MYLKIQNNFLQIKIHITFIDNILFNSDVTEGDGGVGMVKDFLQKFTHHIVFPCFSGFKQPNTMVCFIGFVACNFERSRRCL